MLLLCIDSGSGGQNKCHIYCIVFCMYSKASGNKSKGST